LAVEPEFFVTKVGAKRYRLYVVFNNIPEDSVLFGPEKTPENGCIVFGKRMIFSFAHENNGVKLMRDPASRGKNDLRIRRASVMTSEQHVTKKRVNGKKVSDTTEIPVQIKNTYRSEEFSGSPRFFQVFKVVTVETRKENGTIEYFTPTRITGSVRYHVNSQNPKKMDGEFEQVQVRTAHFDIELPKSRKKVHK
ncbi:MAG TPA: hypothetical protein VLB02_00340, partial [Candidatus Paceibacterota bacterium]|nr:hypothetical protein [Candidatus Paceibacterota bacterium]